MTRVAWWFVDRVSRILEPDERDAVLGDFAESGVAAGQALRDLLGLVVRRQAALWKDWRPWLALLGLVAPLGMLLSLVCRRWAEGSATTLYLYVNGWTFAYLESPGARLDLAQNIGGTCLSYLTLICWSWTIGFVIGSLSRRAIWINGALFGLVLFGELLTVPQHHNPFNPLVWSLTFYSVMLPPILRTFLVLLPSVWGMHRALRLPALPPLQTFLWAVAIAIMTGLETRGVELSVISRWWQLGTIWQLRLLPLAVVWPVGFMVATARWRYWRGKATACLLIVVIVTVIPVLAKTHTGTVIGLIGNHSGGVVVNATVIARNRRNKLEHRTSSDKAGYYTFTSLPVGTYDLIIEKQGFKKAVRENFVLLVGWAAGLNFSLQPSEVPESVSVEPAYKMGTRAGHLRSSAATATAPEKHKRELVFTPDLK